jgi:hypothetical protein
MENAHARNRISTGGHLTVDARMRMRAGLADNMVDLRMTIKICMAGVSITTSGDPSDPAAGLPWRISISALCGLVNRVLIGG